MTLNQQLGRYQLTDKLAIGGTAEIFKAKLLGIEGFEKNVVIKRILPHWSSNNNFISMLIDEAKIMVRLSHERIVQVYELGREDNNYYIAMEYVHGVDLKRLRDYLLNKSTPLSLPEVLYICIEVLRGIDYIHKQKDEKGQSLQIVHRDISPQNILVSTEGTIKIADFGIAHAASRSYETATGVLKGKFSYMSPEQAQGKLLDQRTDIFALGIIFYELLSRTRLFQGKTDLQVLEKVKQFDVNQQSFELLGNDEDIINVARKALHHDFKHRYQNAGDFLKALLEIRTRKGLFIDSDSIAEKVEKTLEAREAKLEALHSIKNRNQILAQADSFALEETKEISSEHEVTRFLDITLAEPIALERTNTLVEADLQKVLPNIKAEIVTPADLKLNKRYPPPLTFTSTKRKFRWIFYPILTFVVSFIALLFWSNRIQKNEAKHDLTPKNSSLVEPAPTFTNNSNISSETQMAESTSATMKNEIPEKNKREKVIVETKKDKEDKRIKNTSTTKTEEPTVIIKNKTTEENNSPIAKGKGLLAVKANPYGVISISGIVSGRENTYSSNVAYGNYSISVAYKGLSGTWKTISKSVRVSKASTYCVANFRPDGSGSIGCK